MEIRFHRKIKKDLRKVDRKTALEILGKHLPLIEDNPEIGDFLKAELSGYRSYHFKINKVEYRIIYRVEKESIFIIAIGTRQDIYPKTTRRV